jgi:putative oxidoreductase
VLVFGLAAGRPSLSYNEETFMTPTPATQNLLALVGRALIVTLFLPFGYGAITGFAGTVRYITSAGLPMPEVVAGIAIFVEVVLGLLLLVGYQTRWAALGILLFTLAAAFVFHAFWNVPPAQFVAQKTNFLKNMAVAGGLFGILAWGPGAWSLDARRADFRHPEAAAA